MSNSQQDSSTRLEDPAPGPSGVGRVTGYPDCEIANSRKRSRDEDGNPGPCCIGGCGNPLCNPKRNAGEDECSEARIRWWYIHLDSDSPNYDSDTPSSLANESIWTVQDADTEPVKDSDDEFSLSDSETRWRAQHRIEFELATDHSSDNEGSGDHQQRHNRHNSSSSTCSSDLETCVVLAVLKTEGLCDYYADSSSEQSDPELTPQDKWSCLKCKEKNQPIPRYCQRCFAVRKECFPPRPRKRGKARRRAERQRAEENRGSRTGTQPLPVPTTRATLSQAESSMSLNESVVPQPMSLSQPIATASSSNTKGTTTIQRDISEFMSVLDSYYNHPKNEVEPAKNPEEGTTSVTSTVSMSQSDTPSVASQADTVIASLDKNVSGNLVNDSTYSLCNNLRGVEIVSMVAVQSTNIKENLRPKSTQTSEAVMASSPKPSNDLSISMIDIQEELNQPSTSKLEEDVVDLGHKSDISSEVAADLKQKSVVVCEDVVDLKQKSISSEDVVDFGRKWLGEDVVDFQRKSIAEDVVDFVRKSTSEDVVDFGRKSMGEDVVDFVRKSTSVDVVDFGRKSMDEDVVDFPRKSIAEDVVDFVRKSTSEDVVDFVRKSTSEDVVDFVRKSMDEDVVDFPRKSISEDVVDFPRKSTGKDVIGFVGKSTSEDVVDFTKKSMDEDVVDFPRKSMDEDVVDFVPKSIQYSKNNYSNHKSIQSSENAYFCTTVRLNDTKNRELEHKATQIPEDMIDLGEKSTQIPEDIVDFCSKSSQIPEDVIDFCMSKSTQISEDVVDFCPRTSKDVEVQSSQYTHSSQQDVKMKCDDSEVVSSQDLRSSQDLFEHKSSQDSIELKSSDDASITKVSVENVVTRKRVIADEDDVENCFKFRRTCLEDQLSRVSRKSCHSNSKDSSIKTCVVCYSNPADTAFTHGKNAHQCVCYQCAKRIFREKRRRCPVCMRSASSFYKIFTA